jgi:hypothetical protein
MTRTVAYLRVSTDKQADRGVSLEAQRRSDYMAFVKKPEAEARVYYWDSSAEAWENDREIRVCYESGTDPCGNPSSDCDEITTDCIANIDSIVTSSGTPAGGIFFYLAITGQEFEGGNCGTGLADGEYRGIVYAKGGN